MKHWTEKKDINRNVSEVEHPALPQFLRSPMPGCTKRQEYRKVLALSSLIIFLVAIPTLIRFNGIFITTDDFIEQQLPFILHCKHLLNFGIPFWDWNSHLGGDFWASYSFYTVGSPFFWMLMPFSENVLPYAIVLSVVAKHITASLTSYWYLSRYVKNNSTALIGSLLYAYSSFTVINEHFNHFTDVIALFPLLLIGIDRALEPENRKRYLLPVAVALNAMANYYFFWSSSLFLLLYFIIKYGFDRQSRQSLRFRKLLQVIFEYFLGIAMACVLWLPAFLYQWDSPRLENFQLSYNELFNKFTGFFWNIFESVRMMLMPAESPRFMVYSPFVFRYHSVAAYLPVFGLSFAIFFCMKKHGHWIKRMIIACMAISLVPYLNGLFTLYTNTWYKRWWYAYVLMCALATCLGFDTYMTDLNRNNQRMLAKIFLALILTLCVIVVPQAFILYLAQYPGLNLFGDAEFMHYFINEMNNPYYTAPGIQLLSLSLTVVNYAVLLGVILSKSIRKHLLPLVCLVILINYISFTQFNDHAVIHYPVHGKEKLFSLEYRYRQTFDSDRPQNEGRDYYSRVDSPSFIKNYALYLNQPSITSFNSVKGPATEFLELAGFGEDQSVMSIPPEHNAALRAFLSVRNYIQYDSMGLNFDIPEGFKKVSQKGEVTLWENMNYIPFGFTYRNYVLRSDVKLNAANIAETMLQAVVIEDERQLDRMSFLQKRGGVKKWYESVRERQRLTCYDFVGNASGFSASIKTEKPELVFFSVPYSRGWTARVNNQAVSIEKVNLCFMAVVVPEGESKIAFSYVTPGIKLGLFISLSTILSCIIYCWVLNRKE